VLTACLDDLGPGRRQVTVDLAEDLPDVIADAALLTRILASLLADAALRCPAGTPPALTASCPDGVVEVRLTDAGPDERGGPASLALRLAADLAEAMGVTLRCERAPSGGRTVILVLPAAARPPSGAPAREKYPDDEMQLT
jgi:two-component system, OmpR family, sensor histidine kinase KdpD